MSFKKLNNIVGWVMFAIAACVYLLTMERELSFWDAGEYIVSSAKLGVTHAPGAATFQLIGAVWSGLAFGDGSLYAILINALSAICSALTILFLFWTLTHFARRILMTSNDDVIEGSNKWAIILTGVVGSAAFMFSDSFWFSAVEGEVYAMASMFTALMLWLACKWENDAGKYRENKWVVLIALLVGLSTGVHLMAILVVPALCYIYYFRHYDFTWKSFAIANVITLAIFVFVFKIIFSTTMSFVGNLEIFMVNELGLPFNSGFLVTIILFAAIFYFGLTYTQKRGWATVNTFILATMFMLIGFSAWLVIPIRANANPHMNLNDPDDAIGLLDYFNREQYGDWPVFNGPLYTAHIDPNGVETNPDGSYKMIDNGPIYKKDVRRGTYEVVGRRTEYVYNKDHIGPFARMYNPQAIENYKAIMGPPEEIQVYNPATGEQQVSYKKPTLGQNIQFFLSYQIGYMYLRYLGWNFMGRQNDFEGNMQVTKGNAITGIHFIDNIIVGGNQENLPTYFKDTESRNVYFGIPLILGLIGFSFQFNRDFGRTFALISLFLLTGVGILLYTNVRPFEPRERDYAVVSSFYVYSIWVGMSVLAIYTLLKDRVSAKAAMGVASLTLIAPVLMGAQNWEDHDRSERRAAHDLAHNYLVNLDKNAILFVYGDNDTYPLWGLQETTLFRDDVKIANFTLLGSPWNISQVQRKTYNADAIKTQMTPDDYKMGVNEGIILLSPDLMEQIKNYAQQNNPNLYQHMLSMQSYVDNGMTAKEAMNWILDRDNPAKKALVAELKMAFNAGIDNVLPTKKIIVPVNKNNVLKHGIVDQKYADQIVPNLVINLKGQQISYKNELFMLDMLANYDWTRGVYFSSGGLYDDVNIFYMNDYLQFEGFTYKLVPIKSGGSEYGERGIINADDMYKQIKNYEWANYNHPKAYFDPTSTNNILTYRNAVARTAEALIKEGKNDKAKEIMDLIQEKIPYQRYSEGITLFSFVPIYNKLGENEKAKELQTFLQNRITEERDYYQSLNEYDRMSVYNEMQQLLGQEQYSVSGLIDYYLKTEKDTMKALEYFKEYYTPIENRIKTMNAKVQKVGLGGLTDAEHNQLSTDLSLQRGILPYAMDIDSTYANKKFEEMIQLMEEMDPRVSQE